MPVVLYNWLCILLTFIAVGLELCEIRHTVQSSLC